jgi:tetratricopeptide (TPR) repeat protein
MRLDPVSMPLYAAEGMASYYARHYQAAIEIRHKALAMDSSFRNAHLLLGMALEAQHRPVEAEREYDGVGLASSGDAEALTRLAHLYATTGRQRQARDTLAKLLAPAASEYVDPYQVVCVYAALGHKKDALGWLAKAVHEHTAMTIKVDPYLDSLRDEPEFDRLLAETHLTQ